MTCPVCGAPVTGHAISAPPPRPGQPIHGNAIAYPCGCWMTPRQARPLIEARNQRAAPIGAPSGGTR